MQTAIVIHPVLGRATQPALPMHGSPLSAPVHKGLLRSPDGALEEAVGLAAAIELDIVAAEVVTIVRPRPSTLFGKGRLEGFKQQLDGYETRPALLVVNGSLSPVQHRNLEKELSIKVVDRTALILEIFGARAQTAEGRLQVELAHLTYQRSRLVRSWTHLERQRGGAGFLGGPGERQIESDRRVLADKIVRLKKKLEEVRRTRNLQRAKRKKAPRPVIALVGYTNAGKSTLFNSLTEASVKAQDLLFATLDPTMRAVTLPSGQEVIFSDTVGFISELPTQLVAAFRATLEEVLEADLIIHVRDISHPDSDAQRADVLSVLSELGVESGGKINGASEDETSPVIEALNKVDLLDREEKLVVVASAKLSHNKADASVDDPVRVGISALTGEGLETMFDLVDRFLTADRVTYRCSFPIQNGAVRAFLHAHGDVLAENVEEGLLILDVRLSEKSRGQAETLHNIDMVEIDEGVLSSGMAR